jgi:nucleotide-binding universal stress UspA family protein
MDALSQERAEVIRLHVVVSVDFSDASDYALEIGRNFVLPFGPSGELHVVHATSPAYWPVGVTPVMSDPHLLDVARDRLRALCGRMAGEPDAEDLYTSTGGRIVPHLRVGEATHEIATVARDVHADLIVIGAHRHPGLVGSLHRSMSARLVRVAPCSVLTALRKEEEVSTDPQIEPACADCMKVRRETGGREIWCPRHARHHVHGHLHHATQDPFSVGSWNFRS